MKSSIFLFFGLISFILLAGCGSKGPYGLIPISGIVTMDGIPAEGASVVFQPRQLKSGEPPGPGSSAFCDAEGRFQLKTVKGDPGAVIATHRVMIFGPRSDDPDADEPYAARYNGKSEMVFIVKADSNDEAVFELTSEP